MTRSETINEYCLAYIKVRAGATEILASDIEDTRQNTDLCGWVTGLVEQITPDTLYAQFTAIFQEWFNGLVDIIDEEVETTLVNAMTRNVEITLDPEAWEDNEQIVLVTGMSATKTVICEAISNEIIKCIGQGTNELTFQCDNVPTSAITVSVTHSGT